MTRAPIDYTERGERVVAEGFNPDIPVAGYYKMRLRSGAVFVGVKIWYGQPLDPVTYEPLDRSLRWCAAVNGRPVELDRVWPKCANHPETAAEYEYLTSLEKWAKENMPSSPQANPRRPINLLTAPINL